MAFKIAPDNSSSPVGLAQMRYALVNKADYNHANSITNATSSLQQIVASPETLQADVSSSTWNQSQPYGLAEMYGQTWSEPAAGPTTYTFNLSVTNGGDDCDKATVTIKKNGTTVATMLSVAGSSPSWSVSSFTATDSDTVLIEAQSQGGGGAGCLNTDTEVTVQRPSGTTVIGPIAASDGLTTHSFTPSANQTISVISTATS